MECIASIANDSPCKITLKKALKFEFAARGRLIITRCSRALKAGPLFLFSFFLVRSLFSLPAPRARLRLLVALVAMAVLVGGQQQQRHSWGLRDRKAANAKTVILVKLTDASLRAIEDFVHRQVRHPRTPTYSKTGLLTSSMMLQSVFPSSSDGPDRERKPNISFPSGNQFGVRSMRFQMCCVSLR